jgi:pyocin large subunit-like protein
VKSSIFALFACFAFAACAAPRTATHSTRANTPAAVEQRIQQLSRDIAQLEREQKTAKERRGISQIRHAWNDYLRARREANALFAEQGLTFDARYYQLQHELLDAQSAQFAQLRQLLRNEWPN